MDRRSTSRHFPLLGPWFAAAALVLAASASAAGSSVELYRVPEATRGQLEAIPKNLARWYLGANLLIEQDGQLIRIQAADVDQFAESALLSDDSALSVPLIRGEHNFIVDFSKFHTLSRFFLNNRGAAGSIRLYAANTLEPVSSERWLPLTPEPLRFGTTEIPAVSFPEVEARYLLMRLDLRVAGEIGHIGATGPANITEVAFESGREKEEHSYSKAKSPVVDYDYGTAFAGARVRYVSGGSMDDVLALIDEDPTTTYSFPRGEEAVMVLDLTDPTEFRSINAGIRAAEPGILHIQLTSSLHEAFGAAEAVGVATRSDRDGHIERMELADASPEALEAFFPRTSPKEIVRVPVEFFRTIENTHSVHLTPESGPYVKVFDTRKHRYAIFRFIPDNSGALPEARTAVYRPGTDGFELARAQTPAPTAFSGISVIGEVQVDNIVFTQEQEPVGPPPPPPPPPPPLSF